MKDKNKHLSIVLPIYNETDNIRELIKRLKNIETHFSTPFEIICVNDGSTDDSLDVMKGLASSDKNIKIVDLSRNFGHQIAIKAGLSFASGDAAIVMDADLQDPPELIEKLVAKWLDGYQVVYAVRRSRKEGILLRLLYATFYRLLKVMARVSMPLDAGDFCLMDKKIVGILAAMSEKNLFLRGLRSWVGYSQIGIEYDRQERYRGDTKYTFFKLVSLALDGIVAFSDIPLKLSSLLGFTIAVGAVIQIIFLFIKRLPIPGTTGIAVLVLFLGGVQLLTIGILGEYMGRIYEESKNRPHFFIKEKINL